ncbi:G-box-binding factor 4 [Linum perenne]
MDTPTPPPSLAAAMDSNGAGVTNDQEMATDVVPAQGSKTVDEMWREIVSGRKELKEEPDEMMTLEDFLAKAGAVDDEDEVKMPQLHPERLSGGIFGFDPVPMPTNAISMLDNVEGSIIGFGNGVEVGHGSGELRVGRGKRGRAPVLEQMDKAAQQRQKRMIKNRESAARSRERKQVTDVFPLDAKMVYSSYCLDFFCLIFVINSNLGIPFMWSSGLSSGIGVLGSEARGGARAATERKGT